jgi:HSP20 family protein
VAHIYRDWRGSDPSRAGEFDETRLRDIFADDFPAGGRGECVPPMDVLETSGNVQILMDLPGVALTALRVLFSHEMIIITGEKLPEGCANHRAAFHLAERGFGRFTRAVRLNGAFDAGQATATLVGGELRVVLPRIDERRGREILIPIVQP